MKTLLNAILTACAFLPVAGAQQTRTPDDRIRVETMAGGMSLVRDVSGDYAQHPTVFNEMNGYAQTSPTRIEYLAHEGSPMLLPVRIIVPVSKRRSGLVLPAKAGT